MKKKLFLSAVISFAFLAYRAEAQNIIYVAPMGSDSHNGDEAHPLKTLKAALELSRIRPEISEIRMSEGEYVIYEPIVFNAKDSHLSITGAGMGKTVISGGVGLPAFQDECDGLWSIDLHGIMISGGDIRQLFVNGRRAVQARTPNEMEYFTPLGCCETLIDEAADGSSPRRGFAVQAINVNEDASKVIGTAGNDITVTFYHAWDITSRPVLSFDPDKRLIYIGGNKMHSYNVIARENCSQFFFEGDKSFLDAPGEFFYDGNAAKLYYKPLAGQEILTSEAVIPAARQLMVFEGSPAEKVEDISVRDLSLEYTRFSEGWRGHDNEQSAASTDAVVMMDFASGITIDNCEISHSGNNGIWIRKACDNCILTHSFLHDLGIGGVKIGATAVPEDESALTRNITVDNNILREGSRTLATGVGVCLFQACDCSITHNEVADFYYSGMSIGWHWGYGYSPSKRNVVNFNHIHHVGWGVLSDMGGIYTLGPSEGTQVSFNVIHHIYSYGYGGWGLYTDEGSTGITIEGNLVYQCKSSAFHQHYGKENHICNNLFINQIKSQMEATRVEDHLSFVFDRNIICYDKGQMYGMQWKTVNAHSDNNMYWHYGRPVSFDGESIEEWRSLTGKDKNSIVADPAVKSDGCKSFLVTNKKAVKRIGFVQPDWTKSGVYGDEGWLKLAEFDMSRAAYYDTVVSSYESPN